MLLPGEWDAAADGDPVEPADDDNDTDTEFADAPLKSKFPPLGEKLFSLALYLGNVGDTESILYLGCSIESKNFELILTPLYR